MDDNVITLIGTHDGKTYKMIYALENGKMHFKNFVSQDDTMNGVNILVPGAMATGLCSQLNR